MRRAAIDIGTNSIRLLIADESGDVVRRAVVTGLGRGVGTTGRMDPDGRDRTLEVLQSYRADMDYADVEKARAVVTAVGRNASDAADFVADARRVLGFAPEVIGGDEEAALSYRGAVAELAAGDWTVVDIGGGSTEVVGARSAVSYEIGSVALTDRYLAERPVPDEGLEAARARASAVLALSPAPGGVVGVAGTWTSLAAMTMRLDPPRPDLVHLSWITLATVGEWVERLRRMSVAETAALPGLDPARAPVILGGTIVAETALTALGVGASLVSEHDLLDGILAGLA